MHTVNRPASSGIVLERTHTQILIDDLVDIRDSGEDNGDGEIEEDPTEMSMSSMHEVWCFEEGGMYFEDGGMLF